MPRDTEPLALDGAMALVATVAETLEGQSALAKVGMTMAKEAGNETLELAMQAVMVNATAAVKQMREVKAQLAPATRRISHEQRLCLLRASARESRALVEAILSIGDSTDQSPFQCLEHLAYQRLEALLDAMVELSDPSADSEQDPDALRSIVEE